MDALVRGATVEDAASVADVLNGVMAEGGNTLFDTPFTVEAERRFLSALDDRSKVLVAEIGGRIVGVQSLGPFLTYNSTKHVATMGTWLRTEVRGRGIGQRLASETFRFARATGYLKVVVHILATNSAAMQFYRGLGFEQIGIARKHVRLADRFHDEIYLEMQL